MARSSALSRSPPSARGWGCIFSTAGSAPTPANVLRVGAGDGGTATITEALAQAGPGQTVEVAPGVYREALQLRSGVSLVSRVPRGALILPPAGSGVPAVTAQGVEGARIAGFRIAGDAQAPLQVGLRLADSAVEVDGVEISGAQTAAIDLAGADRSDGPPQLSPRQPGRRRARRGERGAAPAITT